jgi:hypothetical protein
MVEDCRYTTTEPLESEDYTLTLPEKTRYKLTGKVSGLDFLTFFPYSSEGQVRENVKMAWYGYPLEVSTKDVDRYWQANRSTILKLLQDSGIRAKSFQSEKAYDATLCGQPCIIINHKMFGGMLYTYQRTIYFTNQGYHLTITAFSEENIQKITDLIDTALTWK